MKIVPIVEGYSEVKSIPLLIRRIVSSHKITGVEVATPVRVRRNKITKTGELERAARFAMQRKHSKGIILVLDADDDCPKDLAPKMSKQLKTIIPSHPSGVVLAKREFEAWLIGGIESLRGKRGISNNVAPPPEPESIRDAKGWLTKHMEKPATYVGVDDQPSLASHLDLELASKNCPSLAKFIRDVTRIARDLASGLQS